MRFRLVLALLISGCGGSDDDATEAPPAAPEVTRIGFEQVSCLSFADCSGFISGVCTTGGLCAPRGYTFVASMVYGSTPPAACDGGSAQARLASVMVKMALSTTYSARGCLFNNATGAYSPGAVATFTTPAS